MGLGKNVVFLFLLSLYVMIEFLIKGMSCQGGAVAEYDEFHACSCDGDIHSAKVA